MLQTHVGAELPVEARADAVSFDARQGELDLAGSVRVDAPPFHLSSDKLHVRRTPLGVEVQGQGSVTFCPCLGTPLTISFENATIAPPGDLFLRKPTLRVLGAPVFWLPWIWLRSPGKIGLLPPDIAYRGRDGVFVGDGLHVPWRNGDPESGLDLRAGAYVVGGLAVDGRVRTDVSTTRVRWDHLRADGLAVDARGAIVAEEGAKGGTPSTVAWDIDTLRGARGVVSTSDLDAAARAFDRASAEAAWRAGGFTFASGVRAVSVRGGGVLDFGAAGPTVSARRSEALGSLGAYDMTLDGGTLRGEGVRALSFARFDAGAMMASRLGPVGATFRVRGAGDLADDGERRGVDGVGSARATLAVPMVRAYSLGAAAEPLRHRIEPRLTAGVLGVHDEGVLGALPGRSAGILEGLAWTGYATLYNALGRWGAREGSELEVAVGAVGDAGWVRPVHRWRGAASASFIGAGAEAAHVIGHDGPEGTVIAARSRLGRVDSLHVGALLAYREGTDPVVARALTDAPLEPGSGFLSREGLTGGARVALPWSQVVTTSVGADGDLSARELVLARGSIELRDRCGCLVVRGSAAHRIGRDGVDVWVTLDLSPQGYR